MLLEPLLCAGTAAAALPLATWALCCSVWVLQGPCRVCKRLTSCRRTPGDSQLSTGSCRGQGSSAAQGSGSPCRAPPAYLHQQLQSQAGCCMPAALGDAGSSSVVPHREFLSLIILYRSHNPAKKLSVRFKSTSSPVPLSWPLALRCVPHSSACSPAASWCFLHPCPAALWAAL